MITVNEHQIVPTLFPDHTSQVWKLPEWILKKDEVNVTWEFTHEGEFLHLAQLKSLLDAHGVKARLYIDYLPYGRQDKSCSNDQTFALHTFARLLNLLAFKSIDILDPHSKRATELILFSNALYPGGPLARTFNLVGADILCYPDAGALNKYRYCYHEYEYIHGEKVREQSTGRILLYELKGDPKGKRVLIVDDICDGGATFTFLTKALLEYGASEVSLFVTHGIFSKGLKPLKEAGISRIFTAKGEAVAIEGNIVGTKPI